MRSHRTLRLATLGTLALAAGGCHDSPSSPDRAPAPDAAPVARVVAVEGTYDAARLVTYAPDGSERRDITPTRVVDRSGRPVATPFAGSWTVYGEPHWSPDGRSVAIAMGGHFSAIGQDSVGVVVIPADGGDARLVGDVDGSVVVGDWSPDGREIAYFQLPASTFVSPHLPEVLGDLRAANVQTGAARTVLRGADFRAWLPPNERAAATRRDLQPRAIRWATDGSIYFANVTEVLSPVFASKVRVYAVDQAGRPRTVRDSLGGAFVDVVEVLGIARSGAWALVLRDGPLQQAPGMCQSAISARRLARVDLATGAESDLVRGEHVVGARLTANDERALVAVNVDPYYCARIALEYRSLRPDGSDARPVAGPTNPATWVGIALRP